MSTRYISTLLKCACRVLASWILCSETSASTRESDELLTVCTTFHFWMMMISQQRVTKIIFPDKEYTLSLIFANIDTLQSRREQLTERFFRRCVLRKSSCLHYLLPDKRDSVIIDRLRHAKTFRSSLIKTEKFRKSFIPYCLNHYD